VRRLRFALAFLAAGLALAFVGAGAAQQRATTPLFGFVWVNQDSWRLVRLDPLTLLQRRGPSLAVGSRNWAWSFSPDRSQLVLADSNRGALMLVDPLRMRRLGSVDIGDLAVVRTTFWPDERRLYAVVVRLVRESDGTLTLASTSLLAIDPGTRSIVGEQPLGGTVWGAVHAPGALALLLGPTDGIGAASLALVSAYGTVRTVPLDGVSVGTDATGEEQTPPRVVHYAQPGLAISRDGSSAFVVSPGQIAAVDVATLGVSYHRLGSTGRRLQKVEKGPLDGTSRNAVWARDGRLLVSGVDEHGSIDAKGQAHYDLRPVGLQLVDTTDWSAKMVDPIAGGAQVGANAIVVTPWQWNSARQRYVGGGLTIYSLAGVRRAHLFGKRQVEGIVVGRRAFIVRDTGSYTIVSTTTGGIVRTIRRNLTGPLLGGALDSF
jgi:hypothetical protein